MSDEEVTVVQRPGAEQGLHVPSGIPLKAAERDKVDVRLIGGPHHDQVVSVWVDLKNIVLPVIRNDEPPATAPEVVERVDPVTGATILETKQRVVQAATVFAVYTRRTRKAKIARFTDYKEED